MSTVNFTVGRQESCSANVNLSKICAAKMAVSKHVKVTIDGFFFVHNFA